MSLLEYITISKINPMMKKTIAGPFRTAQANLKYFEGNLPIIINTNFPTYKQKRRSHTIVATTKYKY